MKAPAAPIKSQDEIALEEAKAYLLKSDEKGNNLYEHVTNVLLKLLEQQ